MSEEKRKKRTKTETDWFGNEYEQHYDEEGNPIGRTKTETDWFGNEYEQHYDEKGNSVGRTKDETGWFGDEYEQHYDEEGNPIGRTKDETGWFGDEYEEHYDNEGNPIGRTRAETDWFGNEYDEHEYYDDDEDDEIAVDEDDDSTHGNHDNEEGETGKLIRDEDEWEDEEELDDDEEWEDEENVNDSKLADEGLDDEDEWVDEDDGGDQRDRKSSISTPKQSTTAPSGKNYPTEGRGTPDFDLTPSYFSALRPLKELVQRAQKLGITASSGTALADIINQINSVEKQFQKSEYSQKLDAIDALKKIDTGKLRFLIQNKSTEIERELKLREEAIKLETIRKAKAAKLKRLLAFVVTVTIVIILMTVSWIVQNRKKLFLSREEIVDKLVFSDNFVSNINEWTNKSFVGRMGVSRGKLTLYLDGNPATVHYVEGDLFSGNFPNIRSRELVYNDGFLASGNWFLGLATAPKEAAPINCLIEFSAEIKKSRLDGYCGVVFQQVESKETSAYGFIFNSRGRYEICEFSSKFNHTIDSRNKEIWKQGIPYIPNPQKASTRWEVHGLLPFDISNKIAYGILPVGLLDNKLNCKVVFYKSKIMAYVNNELVCSKAFDEFSSIKGKVAFVAEYGLHVDFDNIKVYSLKQQ